VVPVDEVRSLTRELFFSCDPRVARRPDKQINKVLVALINQGRDRAVVEVIQAAANQSESLLRQILRGRGVIKFAAEPWFDGMLIGRGNVGDVVRQH